MVSNDNLIRTFWQKRFYILKITLLFLVIGVVIAVLSTKKYMSKTIILPQVSAPQGLGKKLGGFAKLVGINIGDSGKNEIFPTLYPVIAESTPFQQQILRTNITKKNDSLKVSEYLKNAKLKGPSDYIKEYTVGLPGKIIGLFKSDKSENLVLTDSVLFTLTKEEKRYLEYLNKNVEVSFNEIEGYIEIYSLMPDALPAAQLTKSVQELLQDYIIELNISKAKDEVEYLEKRVIEAEETYKDIRDRFGRFRDQNKNYILSITENEYEQLRNENELAYNIYSQLATQLESAKLQVKRDTPIFTVLKPVTVPLEPAGPNKVLIIFTYLVLGFIFGCLIILFRLYWPELKSRYLRPPST